MKTIYSLFLALVTFVPFLVKAQDKATVNRLESPYYVFPRTGGQHIDLSADWKLTFRRSPSGESRSPFRGEMDRCGGAYFCADGILQSRFVASSL